MSSSQSATPPMIPGSLNVDTIQVNKILKIVDQVVGDALSDLNSWKGAVDAASTGFIASLSGEQTVDGVALVNGDKVLVKDQGVQNGLYIVQYTAWYRSDDMVDGTNAAGFAVFVKDGSDNNDQIFVCTNADGSDVVGTDALDFANINATISAAGADTNVQYNSGGNFAGDAKFTYDGNGAVASTVSMTSDLISGVTLTDGTATLTASNLSGVGNVGCTSVTATGTVQGVTLTDGVGSTMTGGVVTGVTLTDGTASLTSSNLSGVGGVGCASVTATGAVSGGSFVVSAKATGTEAANAVTASGTAGVITTSALTTAAAGTYAVTWTNTFIAADSVVLVTLMGGTNTTPGVQVSATAGAGTSSITITNNDVAAAALNGTLILGFVVL